LLESRAGVSQAEFVQAWLQALARARAHHAPALARLPRPQGSIEFVPLSGSTRAVRYQVQIEPAPAPGTRYWVYYDELPVLDEEVDLTKVHRVGNTFPEGAGGELPGTFAVGTRLYWTISLRVPELGCDVVSGWQRQEVR
jgi:hypothetical protein